MKKVIGCLAILSFISVFSQKNDSITSNNNIQEVVLKGKYYKKYIKKRGSSSMRLDEELIKIPQNISIVTRRALEDQQVTSISDGVLRNISGAQRIEHWSDLYTRFTMRGSRAGSFLNGVNVTSNFGPLSEDMSFVDHIEIIKGPAGFLMSNGESGGMYNIVTKKPTGGVLNGIARMMLGSFSTYRGEVDIDTKLNEKVAFRLNIMAANKKSFRDYEFNDRYIINPSFKFNFSDKTSMTAEYIYQRAKMSELGSAYIFSLKGYADKPVGYTVSDPGIDPTKVESHMININLQHKFNEHWKLTNQLTYVDESTLGSDIWINQFVSENKIIRNLSLWDSQNNMKFGQVFLNGWIKEGAMSHKILAGLDLGSKKYIADWGQTFELDTEENPFDMNAGSYQGPKRGYPKFNRDQPLLERASPSGITEQHYTGVSLQDELGFFEDALRLTLAARYTSVKENNYGVKSHANKINPRIGLSYSINENLSLYTLYDQSFVPQAGLFRDGSTAKPLTANNVEFGIKKDWLSGKWNTSLSLYSITKHNAIAADPSSNNVNNKYAILLGKTRVQGTEFDLKGEVLKGFNVILNYAFTENKFIETTALHKKGDLVPGYAKHAANAWLNYTFLDGHFAGFGI
ncbi:TonB-dependent siderophore receptor [Elizabethkingia argentiflava]|uniref:TonB-dependent siderophore receptor n=1 Tax=Elizabethkingia argenteiflava TaxID=2681556 RepID=A0A845Q0R4_9FLAO|nr:TonB-dependent siderophore receptor [Elizabethkingia argenteiflava]NAW52277.1 TonB-dependent siderophore receptor [Elizabethkingia argenteiflava]